MTCINYLYSNLLKQPNPWIPRPHFNILPDVLDGRQIDRSVTTFSFISLGFFLSLALLSTRAIKEIPPVLCINKVADLDKNLNFLGIVISSLCRIRRVFNFLLFRAV